MKKQQQKKWEVLYTILPQEKVKEISEQNWDEILDLPYPPNSLQDIIDTLYDLMAWYDEEISFTIMVPKDFQYLEDLKKEFSNVIEV